MRKIAKILDNVRNVNDFDVVDEILLTRGNQTNLYFQLITERQNSAGGNDLQRYVPQGTVIKVDTQFDNLSMEYLVRRAATNPFPEDTSIWMIPIIAQDQILFNGMRVTINEDGVETFARVETDIATEEVGDRRRFT